MDDLFAAEIALLTAAKIDGIPINLNTKLGQGATSEGLIQADVSLQMLILELTSSILKNVSPIK